MGTLSLVAPLVLFEKSRLWVSTGFHLLPSFHHHHHTTQLHYTNSYTYSHLNLNFLQYTIQILVLHVMWSAQVVRELKIDQLNAIYLPCAEPEARNSAVGWHWNTHTFSWIKHTVSKILIDLHWNVCVPMPTHRSITCFGFRARRIAGVECCLFSIHAPLR